MRTLIKTLLLKRWKIKSGIVNTEDIGYKHNMDRIFIPVKLNITTVVRKGYTLTLESLAALRPVEASPNTTQYPCSREMASTVL